MRAAAVFYETKSDCVIYCLCSLFVSSSDADEQRQCLPGLAVFSVVACVRAYVRVRARVSVQCLGLWSCDIALTDALWRVLAAYEQGHRRDLNASNYIPQLEW